MRALLYTDWCTVRGTLRQYLLVCGGMCAILCASNMDNNPSAHAVASDVQMTFMSLTSMMIAMMCFFGLFANDERVGWEALRLALPFSRREVVRSRYVFFLALVVSVTLVSAVVGTLAGAIVSGALYGTPVLATDPQALLVMAACILGVMLYCALEMPLFFWKGAAKARIAFSLPLLLIPLLTIPGAREGIQALAIDPHMAVAISVPVALVALLASLLLSQRLYEARDF